MIVRYYDACNTGDVEAMLELFTPDVTHWFLAPNLASTPVRGAEYLARYWRKVQARFQGRWVVERLLAAGDEAVIEWTLYWSPPGTGTRVVTRGSEWFEFQGDRIREIRAYYHQGAASSELEGFPYAERGYSGLGREHSAIHPSRPDLRA